MNWLRKLSLDLRMGRCSGFPPCCVLSYVTIWRVIFGRRDRHIGQMPPWRRRIVRAYHDKAGEPGYIPCPWCLISGARVGVRRCDERCRHMDEVKELYG